MLDSANDIGILGEGRNWSWAGVRFRIRVRVRIRVVPLVMQMHILIYADFNIFISYFFSQYGFESLAQVRVRAGVDRTSVS